MNYNCFGNPASNRILNFEFEFEFEFRERFPVRDGYDGLGWVLFR